MSILHQNNCWPFFFALFLFYFYVQGVIQSHNQVQKLYITTLHTKKKVFTILSTYILSLYGNMAIFNEKQMNK